MGRTFTFTNSSSSSSSNRSRKISNHSYARYRKQTSETNRVSKLFGVTTTLYLQFMLHVMLFPILNVLNFYISTVWSTCAVHSMAVSFCNSLISCFPGMLLDYCLSDFEMAQLPLLLLVLLFYLRSASAVCLLRGLYILESSELLSWLNLCFVNFQHLINIHVSFLLAWIMRSAFWLRVVLSVGTCKRVGILILETLL